MTSQLFKPPVSAAQPGQEPVVPGKQVFGRSTSISKISSSVIFEFKKCLSRAKIGHMSKYSDACRVFLVKMIPR